MTLLKIPSREGREGFSLQGWVLPSGQPTPTPLQWRGIIFILLPAANGGRVAFTRCKLPGLAGKRLGFTLRARRRKNATRSRHFLFSQDSSHIQGPN